MAVQKSKGTRARRGSRRGHDRVKSPSLCLDEVTGEVHRRHHVTADGFYRGKKVLQLRED